MPIQYLAMETTLLPFALPLGRWPHWPWKPDLASSIHYLGRCESSWRTSLKASQRVCTPLSFAIGVLPFFLCATRMVYFHHTSRFWKSRHPLLLILKSRLQRTPLQSYKWETPKAWQENTQKIKRKLSFGPETDTLSTWSCPLAYLMLQLPCKTFNEVF